MLVIIVYNVLEDGGWQLLYNEVSERGYLIVWKRVELNGIFWEWHDHSLHVFHHSRELFELVKQCILLGSTIFSLMTPRVLVHTWGKWMKASAQ